MAHNAVAARLIVTSVTWPRDVPERMRSSVSVVRSTATAVPCTGSVSGNLSEEVKIFRPKNLTRNQTWQRPWHSYWGFHLRQEYVRNHQGIVNLSWRPRGWDDRRVC
jgi:hypothetical protein